MESPRNLKRISFGPPRDAPISWYKTVALEKMREHSAIYLTPFSHRLAEEIDYPEYQRFMRCRVNYHALRFKPHIMKLSKNLLSLNSVHKVTSWLYTFDLRWICLHIFAGCLDIFTPEEQSILKKYRKEKFCGKGTCL